jgi:hypothetical protein
MDDSHQQLVLNLLAKEWQNVGPPGIMDISDVVACLPIGPSQTLAALKELFSIGRVDMNTLETAVFLTPEGYDSSIIKTD